MSEEKSEEKSGAAPEGGFVSEGVRLIGVERARQVAVLGYSPSDDDQLPDGSLSMAAACYAADERIYVRDDLAKEVVFKDPWPWDSRFDKRPHGDGNYLRHDLLTREKRLDLLVKAGALVAAEIDKLLRAPGEDAT